MEEGYGEKIHTYTHIHLWGTQNIKLKQCWLKDYILLGYPPFPFFFLFVWKGKESSLHPLRSLPDPFVNVCGWLQIHFSLPECLLLMLGQWACMCMGSGTRQTWVQILLLPPTYLLSYHSQPTTGFLQYMPEYTGWLVPLPIMLWKGNAILSSSPSRTLDCCLNYFILSSQVEVWEKRRWGAPNTCSLHWIPLVVHLRVKNEAKKKTIKNMEKAAVYHDHYLIYNRHFNSKSTAGLQP